MDDISPTVTEVATKLAGSTQDFAKIIGVLATIEEKRLESSGYEPKQATAAVLTGLTLALVTVLAINTKKGEAKAALLGVLDKLDPVIAEIDELRDQMDEGNPNPQVGHA